MRNHLKTTCTNLSIYVLLHTKYVLEDIWYDQDWCRMKIKKLNQVNHLQQNTLSVQVKVIPMTSLFA